MNEATGSCQRVCSATTTCSAIQTGSICALFSGGTVNGVSYGSCSTPCNLASPDEPDGAGEVACEPGQTCVEFGVSGMEAATECSTVTESGTAGSSCSYEDECAPGYGCEFASSTATTGTCTEWCTNIAGECSNGNACAAFSPAFSINGVEYGFCSGTPTPSCQTNTATTGCMTSGDYQCSTTLCCPSTRPYGCLTAPLATACYLTAADALAACPDACAVCTYNGF